MKEIQIRILSPEAVKEAEKMMVFSATPFQLKHMISQRVCHRDTTETKYVMLKICEALYELSPEMFSIKTSVAGCQEGKMCCMKSIGKRAAPKDILKAEYPLIVP